MYAADSMHTNCTTFVVRGVPADAPNTCRSLASFGLVPLVGCVAVLAIDDLYSIYTIPVYANPAIASTSLQKQC